MYECRSVFLYSPYGFPLRPISALTEDTSMITVSSCSVKSSQAWKDGLKHWAYTCTFLAFHITIKIFFPLGVYNLGGGGGELFGEVNKVL